jgi:hypothetical protein
MLSTPPGPAARADPPVEALAREFELPLDEVRRLYERTRAELDSGAHVHHYVPIFAVRKMRELLRRRRADASR